MRRSSFNFNQNEGQELCFDASTFLRESFSIDQFLRDHRNKATLEVLRNDLGTYLKTLRLSMIDLINKDYEDFVNLSKDLVGLNTGIEVLQGPLEQVRSEIFVVKNSIEETISGLQRCLEQDRAVKEKKQSLFHLSQVISSTKKLKTLLKVDDSTSRTDVLDLIERASTEYTMLHFSVSKCQPMMSRGQREEWESLGIILMDLLNNTFLECLCQRHASRLARCLRIYSNLDKVAEAETLIRKEVVSPYLYELVNESSLQKQPDDLGGIYQRVLEFLDTQLSPLLQLRMEGGVRFNFLVNGLWVELTRRMEVHMGSVFAAGDPETFHKRFSHTTAFMDTLRLRCDSPAAAARFSSHPQTIHFMQKWNLLVYYKIRFQEIAGQLECVMGEGTTSAGAGELFSLKVATTAVSCLQRCWDSHVLIPQLAHVFWRLSLQILSRYCVWVDEEILKLQNQKTESRGDESPVGDKLTLNKSSLHLLMSLHLDTERLASESLSLLSAVIEQLPGSADIHEKVHSSLAESKEQLSSVLCHISDATVALLVRECVLPLTNVKDIPRLFRRTNRETPTKPCDYVQHVLHPLTSFYNSNKTKVPDKVLAALVTAVFSEVSRQFYSCVSEVLDNAQKTEESLRRLKKAKDKYSGGGESKGSSDDDKIRQQLVVDVHTYCSGARALNVPPENIAMLKELNELVESARGKSERQ